MYIIPGGAGHANIYKNLKGKKLEQLTRDLNKKLSPEVDFGASVFPYGSSLLRFSCPFHSLRINFKGN